MIIQGEALNAPNWFCDYFAHYCLNWERFPCALVLWLFCPLLPQLGKISLFTCAHTTHSLEQHIIKVKILLLHHFNMWTSIVNFNVILFVSSFTWILSHVVLPQTLKTKLYYGLLCSLCHDYICLVSFVIPTSKEFKDFLIICTKG